MKDTSARHLNSCLDFGIRPSDVLATESGTYKICEFLGQGTYGKVAECIKLSTNEKLAMKIVKSTMPHVGEREVKTLEKLRALDMGKNNLVELLDHFVYRRHVCLVFEKLDITVFDLMKAQSFEPLHLSEIRVIAQQMLVSLNALKSVGLVHADIKPDNIMLVNHRLHPFKVKLIDFGLAVQISKMKSIDVIQAVGYRAPEVILGLPLDEAVDMWALGCVLAFMYMGRHLYPTRSQYDVMKFIVQMQGQPDDHLLDSGRHSKRYFTKRSPNAKWSLKPQQRESLSFLYSYTSLYDIAHTQRGGMDSTQYEDTRAFISLLKRMLHVDPKKRITPLEALGHRFITTEHLHGPSVNKAYYKSACLTRARSQMKQSCFEIKRFVTSSVVMSMDETSISSSDDSQSSGQDITVVRSLQLESISDTSSTSDSQSSVVVGTSVPSDQEESVSETSNTGLDESLSSDKTDDNDTDDTDDTAACTDDSRYKTTTEHTSGTNTEKRPGVFVEVKVRTKWLKRVRQFFSRMCKPLSCCKKGPKT